MSPILIISLNTYHKLRCSVTNTKNQVPCTGPGSFFKWVKKGEIILKMGDGTHFMEGYFYKEYRFVSISYFLTEFGEW